MKRRFVFAMDSFKGSVDSMAAGRAAAEGARRVFPDAELMVRPVADGGEGTVDALVSGLGGEIRRVEVAGPIGEKVECPYGVLPDGVAVIEMAGASGLPLVPPDRRDPRVTTTYGVGEVIKDAIARGCRRFLVGIGGSATNDGGAGMLQALGFSFLDANGAELPSGGAALARRARIDRGHVMAELADCEFGIACDVTNPLCGPNGASAVFGPQKGADPAAVRELDAALAHFAAVAGGDAAAPGAGAAGGLGFAFRTFLEGELRSGVDLVLEETRFVEAVRDADVVVTGEGRLDAQTAMGKAPAGVAKVAKASGAKLVVALSGCIGPGADAVNGCGIDAFFPVIRSVVSLAEALDQKNARRSIADTAEQVFRLLREARCSALGER